MAALRMIRSPKTMFDLEVDATERLLTVLKGLPAGQRLQASAKMAGAQIEWQTPAIMGDGPNGVYTGLVANVPPNGILVVLADPTRVATIHCHPTEAIAADTLFGGVLGGLDPADDYRNDIVPVLHHILDKAGGKPGTPSPALDPAETSHLLGLLLMVLPTAARARLAEQLDYCRDHQVCPAIVGLLGPASSGEKDHYSAIWPLLLPVAPYADDFVADAEKVV